MVMDRVGASFEVVGDDPHGVSKDQLVEDFVFAIGEPGFGVVHIAERKLGFASEQREQVSD